MPRCMVGVVLGCAGQLSQWGALGCMLMAMALGDCTIIALLRAARVAHSGASLPSSTVLWCVLKVNTQV